MLTLSRKVDECKALNVAREVDEHKFNLDANLIANPHVSGSSAETKRGQDGINLPRIQRFIQ